MHVSLEDPPSGEKQDRQEPVRVQNSGHVDDDTHISAMDAFHEVDGRESRYIKEVLDWYRDEDAGDLRRSESVESITCLNAVEEKGEKNMEKLDKLEKWEKQPEHRDE